MEVHLVLIDSRNYADGNRAVASVLLLYYHLLRQGGIENDETVYLDPATFNATDWLGVQVSEDYAAEIDQRLLREGAVVAVLCDLNDWVSEHEDDFLRQPFVIQVVAAQAAGRLAAIPEADAIVRLLLAGESQLNYDSYRQLLRDVFDRYVVARMRDLLPG